jgi:type IV pilus assembly protein PilC
LGYNISVRRDPTIKPNGQGTKARLLNNKVELTIPFDRIEKFSVNIDKIKLDFPVVGRFLISSYIARFCLIMSSMVGAGVDIVSALEISRDVIPNKYFKRQLDGVIENVKVGNQINTSMSQYKIFDSLIISMIKVGEEAGMLYETLSKMAELYEEQTQQKTKQLTALMEPAMTIIIAVIVGTVVLSVVMPMFNMYSIIR